MEICVQNGVQSHIDSVSQLGTLEVYSYQTLTDKDQIITQKYHLE
jgi:hypothetical protein